MARFQTGSGGQADVQLRGLAGRQRLQADRRGLFQRSKPAAAGDQHQAVCRAGQQPADLIAPGGVIQHYQYLLAGQALTPIGKPLLDDVGLNRTLERVRQALGRLCSLNVRAHSPDHPQRYEFPVGPGTCHGLFPCRFTSVDAQQGKIHHFNATLLAVYDSQ